MVPLFVESPFIDLLLIPCPNRVLLPIYFLFNDVTYSEMILILSVFSFGAAGVEGLLLYVRRVSFGVFVFYYLRKRHKFQYWALKSYVFIFDMTSINCQISVSHKIVLQFQLYTVEVLKL